MNRPDRPADTLPREFPARLQDLPPPQARFCLGIERFLRDELGVCPAGTTLVLGLSGGLDSTALALVLHYLAPRLGCSLAAAHLDHGLRPESTDDARAVQALCRQLNIPCTLEHCDVQARAVADRTGLEAAGRSARYELMERTRRARTPGFVVTGHQLDDLAEDQLMRLVRGAGWPALGGMAGFDPGRNLLRPLLLTPRHALAAFLRALGRTWRHDASNEDERFLRNRIRARILPALKQENPAYLDGAAALWRQARLDADYWTRALPETPPDALDSALLRELHPAQRLRLYKRAIETLGPGQPLCETLLRLDRSWQERRSGACFQFPGGKTARITRQGIAFSPPDGGGPGSRHPDAATSGPEQRLCAESEPGPDHGIDSAEGSGYRLVNSLTRRDGP